MDCPGCLELRRQLDATYFASLEYKHISSKAKEDTAQQVKSKDDEVERAKNALKTKVDAAQWMRRFSEACNKDMESKDALIRELEARVKQAELRVEELRRENEELKSADPGPFGIRLGL